MPSHEVEELRQLVAELTRRVYRLERATGLVGEPDITRMPQTEPVSAVVPPSPPVVPLSPPPVVAPPPTVRPGANREVSLESRIGSQWLNRIGIVATLIGISYFLKYAFESNWIGPAGRVAIGLLGGALMIAWSERFRSRGHKAFSYSLKAVGVGALYLSLWAAYQVYHLVPSAVAFVAMVLVTAFTATLALRQDAQILAAFALLGGFLTPVLVSTGQNRPIELFSYVALLDVATLVMVRVKPWRRLLLAAYAGTLFLYIGWYAAYYRPEALGTALAIVTLLFVIFHVAPLIADATGANGDKAPNTLIALSILNAGTYFLQLYVLLEGSYRGALAWIAIVLAALYLGASREIQRRFPATASGRRVLQLIYVALAIGFATVAIPLKLETHWITLGWLAESAVLFWVGFRVRSGFIKAMAMGSLVLGLGKLLLVDDFSPRLVIANARFLTYVASIAAIGWAAWLVHKSKGRDRQAVALAIVVINVLALAAFTMEAADYFDRQLESLRALRTQQIVSAYEFRSINTARDFAHSAVWMVYGAGLMWAGFWRRSAFLRWQALILIAVTVVKVFIYDVSALEKGYRILSFIALGALLLGISFVYQMDWLKLSARNTQEKGETA